MDIIKEIGTNRLSLLRSMIDILKSDNEIPDYAFVTNMSVAIFIEETMEAFVVPVPKLANEIESEHPKGIDDEAEEFLRKCFMDVALIDGNDAMLIHQNQNNPVMFDDNTPPNEYEHDDSLANDLIDGNDAMLIHQNQNIMFDNTTPPNEYEHVEGAILLANGHYAIPHRTGYTIRPPVLFQLPDAVIPREEVMMMKLFRHMMPSYKVRSKAHHTVKLKSERQIRNWSGSMTSWKAYYYYEDNDGLGWTPGASEEELQRRGNLRRYRRIGRVPYRWFTYADSAYCGSP